MILGFDTATETLTIALGDGDQIRAHFHEKRPRRHLQQLLPTIDSLMREAGLAPRELTHLAVGIGPGSFAGVRVGVATARGLAQALGIPLVGISTLDVIAAGVSQPVKSLVYPLIDAKRDQVYVAAYNVRRTTDYAARDPRELAKELAASGQQLVLAGNGLEKYEAVFQDLLGEHATIAPSGEWEPNAQVLIELAKDRIDVGQIEPYELVLPIYVRQSDAEENLKRVKSS